MTAARSVGAGPSGGATRADGPGRGGGSGGVRIGIALLVIAAVVMIVINQKAPEHRPFDLDSTAVDGYGGLRILLEHRGIEPRQIRADDELVQKLGAGAVLVVPAPELATADELSEFLQAGKRGAKVVYGSAPAIPGDSDSADAGDFFGGFSPGRRELADSPILSARPGVCDIAELSDLGAIDVAFGNSELSGDALSFVDPDSRSIDQRSCYGTPEFSWFRSTDVGEPNQGEHAGGGEVVVMGSPYLWANARLQPAKESDGPVPDNAATAVRLLHVDLGGEPATVTVVRALRSPGTSADGTKSPIELLPFGVKLALAQLLGAFAIFVWWRARRLGAPMIEPLPVEIAGSELVAAVGSLRHRRGDVDRAARALRANMRRTLGMSLGVPPTAPFEALVDRVAQRSGLPSEQIRSALADSHVGSRESLVTLSETLESIRWETQDVHEH